MKNSSELGNSEAPRRSHSLTSYSFLSMIKNVQLGVSETFRHKKKVSAAKESDVNSLCREDSLNLPPKLTDSLSIDSYTDQSMDITPEYLMDDEFNVEFQDATDGSPMAIEGDSMRPVVICMKSSFRVNSNYRNPSLIYD